MFGIIGQINFDGSQIDPALLKAMLATTARCSDEIAGIQAKGQVGFGYFGSAAIDQKDEPQPIKNEDGALKIVCRGTIYNAGELRASLESTGHIFRAQSEMEIIVHAYEQWGVSCVERFRGMFAFAVIDWPKREIFLARDHLGIKPLVYALTPRFFAFASELRVLRKLPGLAGELNLAALDAFLALRYIPAPDTAYKHIRKLPPAGRMVVNFDGKISGPEQYWEPVFRPNHKRGKAEWIEALDATLAESVRAHMSSGIRCGVLLSGGIDSSAVLAYMAEQLGAPVKAFSIGFEEPEFDETAHARQAAERFGAELHVEIVKSDALKILPELLQCHGEPFGDTSALPVYYLARMAGQSVPIALAGDGGDEGFAGYESYAQWMAWLNRDDVKKWKRLPRICLERLAPWHWQPRVPTAANWLRFAGHISLSARERLWRKEILDIADVPPALAQAFKEAKTQDPCSTAQATDMRTYLPDDIFAKVNIAETMRAIEMRAPIVDARVIEFAATIPRNLNMAKTPSGQWTGKQLLRDTLRRFYPDSFLDRPKQGFVPPTRLWLKNDKPFFAQATERLLAPDSPLSDLFEREALRNEANRNAGSSVWLFMVLDEWLRQNKTT